jgi:hypothetical protein
MPMATSSSAIHEYQRTLRRTEQIDEGRDDQHVAAHQSCMNGMLTPSNVNDIGTVNSTNAVPSQDSAVHALGTGTLQPKTRAWCADLYQPAHPTNEYVSTPLKISDAGKISSPPSGRFKSGAGIVASERVSTM